MPYYLLEKIIDAAKCKEIIYGGRKVSTDISNLCYTLDDVSDCISKLELRHFEKTIEYPNGFFDVYQIEYIPKSKEEADNIYLKLRLLQNDKIQVSIGSFHL
jgi:hypothetical protein